MEDEWMEALHRYVSEGQWSEVSHFVDRNAVLFGGSSTEKEHGEGEYALYVQFRSLRQRRGSHARDHAGGGVDWQWSTVWEEESAEAANDDFELQHATALSLLEAHERGALPDKDRPFVGWAQALVAVASEMNGLHWAQEPRGARRLHSDLVRQRFAVELRVAQETAFEDSAARAEAELGTVQKRLHGMLGDDGASDQAKAAAVWKLAARRGADDKAAEDEGPKDGAYDAGGGAVSSDGDVLWHEFLDLDTNYCYYRRARGSKAIAFFADAFETASAVDVREDRVWDVLANGELAVDSKTKKFRPAAEAAARDERCRCGGVPDAHRLVFLARPAKGALCVAALASGDDTKTQQGSRRWSTP
ncbi:hypothetical protein JL721_12080 [Aureococcus anophagefferens]|nr:hypothetical protein JL721_12080 [Aureococcus anophagefferens]